MGDRANVVIKSEDEQVCLYSHWGGSELPEVLKAALTRGKDRLDDFQYLTRIVFCEMVKGHEMQTTGFGISQSVHDGAAQVITLDVDDQTIQIKNRDKVSIEDFLRNCFGWDA